MPDSDPTVREELKSQLRETDKLVREDHDLLIKIATKLDNLMEEVKRFNTEGTLHSKDNEASIEKIDQRLTQIEHWKNNTGKMVAGLIVTVLTLLGETLVKSVGG